MFKTYKYKDYFITTDKDPGNPAYEFCFDNTDEEVVMLEDGLIEEVLEQTPPEEIIINE
jgi:hypothetical protein